MIALAMKNYLKIFLCALIVLSGLPLCLAVDHVVISEVYYDPVDTETGGEALELYNPSDSSVDIGGWAVMTESSATDATVPLGTVMPPHSYFLVADAGWSTSRDNASWPDADLEEPITMGNSDAGVALVYPNSSIVDAVGWGDPLNIDPGLFESVPAVDVASGSSLQRPDPSLDSDDNSADFQEAVPDLKNSGYEENQSGQGITVQVDIEANAPSVDYLLIAGDEDSAPGVQISPLPGQNRSVTILTEVSDLDGTGNIVSVTATVGALGTFNMQKLQDINSTTAEYSADIDMEFFYAPGTYAVSVNASDATLSSGLYSEFEYLAMTAISIDTSDLKFSGAALGSTSDILGDLGMGNQAPTVRNTGNTLLDLGVYGSDLVDGENSIPISNLRYSFDNDFGSPLSGTVPYIAQTVSLGLEAGELSTIGFGLQLGVPQDAQSGNYTGAVHLVAVGG